MMFEIGGCDVGDRPAEGGECRLDGWGECNGREDSEVTGREFDCVTISFTDLLVAIELGLGEEEQTNCCTATELYQTKAQERHRESCDTRSNLTDYHDLLWAFRNEFIIRHVDRIVYVVKE